MQIGIIASLERGQNNIDYRLRTRLPARAFAEEGTYKLKYSNIPIFDSDLPHNANFRPWFNELIPIENSERKTITRVIRNLHFTSVGSIQFTEDRSDNKYAIYLKVNKQTPGLTPISVEGVFDDPLEFSWEVRGPKNPRKYRYRLLPDTKWSSWTSDNKKNFFYMAKGNHVFEVEGKYQESSNNWIAIPPVKYSLNLNKPFIASPGKDFLKSDSEIFDQFYLQQDDKNLMYDNKYALIIGIESFDDLKFSPLPYMQNDVKLMNDALSNLNFEVQKHTGNLKGKEITHLIKESVEKLKQNDFLVIYLSSHGFNTYSSGYVASSNCDRESGNGCMSLLDLEQIVTANSHEGKHVLVLMDTCSSGLGIINKDSNFPERDMVYQRGTIMITAGLENQSAQMIEKIKSSVFTYYLAKGLNGEADIIKDKIISTTELLLYVRHGVAKYTNGMQIPMMGRISGSGEMIFQ